MRNNVEVNGVAANDAAERDHAIIPAARSSRRLHGDRDCGRDFQRSGHGDAIEFRARFF